MPLTTSAAAEEFADPVNAPVIQRRWVTAATGGHVGGVLWHTHKPTLVLLHDAGSSARAWDEVLLALDRPTVALDLPGHGRSSRRSRGDYRPRRLAADLEQTVRSFAPGGVPVVGLGFGALVAIALKAKFPHSAGRLRRRGRGSWSLPGARHPLRTRQRVAAAGAPPPRRDTPLPRRVRGRRATRPRPVRARARRTSAHVPARCRRLHNTGRQRLPQVAPRRRHFRRGEG
ncbi:alpha/beta fold hydrolase [Streptomyces sp. NBC_01615]|uniref:alpha/beta fold hydrolase n=1 Tax=Streptomyces sp. NBC_01615 TaxID=2975898 RepID=UPI00386E2F62